MPRKLMTVQNKDADFTQQMGQSGRQVLTESLPDCTPFCFHNQPDQGWLRTRRIP